MQTIELNNRECFEEFRQFILDNAYQVTPNRATPYTNKMIFLYALNGVAFTLLPDVILEEDNKMWLEIWVEDRKTKKITSVNYIKE